MNKKFIIILSLIFGNASLMPLSFDIRRYICCCKSKQEDYQWTEKDGTETIVTFTENPYFRKKLGNSKRQDSMEVDIKIIHKQQALQANEVDQLPRDSHAETGNNFNSSFAYNNPMHTIYTQQKNIPNNNGLQYRNRVN